MPSLLPLMAVIAATSTTAASPRIELITMGAGGYLYSYWGHSALRVIDPRDGSDSAYNFGGVDFSEGIFMRMMRGYVSGFMYQTPFAELLTQYAIEDRTITRRVLELPSASATLLADRLKAMAAAPRTYYTYHHFYDNCTTQIANELDRALEGKLRALSTARAHGTFRSRVLHPVREHTLLYVMLDLSYSSVVDRPITEWEAAFLGRGLTDITGRATIDGKRLVSHESDVFRSIGFDESEIWTWPWTKIYMLFIAPLCLLIASRPKIGAAIFGAVAGAIGLVFIALWIGSTYDFFHGNWNLLVFPPTHVVLVAGVRSKHARALRVYVAVWTVVLALLFVLLQAGVITQAIGPALGAAIPPLLLLVLHGPYRLRTG